MSKRRIKFSKMGMAKYISHLDLLRCFTRSIMRSGLPVEYSQGFNPHQKMTFALPLPVGVTSECEYVDISFEDGKASDREIEQKLNDNLPPDIRVLSVGDIVCKASDIVCAEYFIKLHSEEEIMPEWIKNFFSLDEIIVMKKTKKKTEKPINIFEFIKAWEIIKVEEKTADIRIVLDAGGERNLKPDVVVSAFCERHQSICADEAEIHRKEVFVKNTDGVIIEKFN
ncbi:MAG: DUF2344 domain-containing protein [Ruminococcaceae bacterium]|nr:DUF2344 domain-containing protein [Oscillospiraceae bacterium]